VLLVYPALANGPRHAVLGPKLTRIGWRRRQQSSAAGPPEKGPRQERRSNRDALMWMRIASEADSVASSPTSRSKSRNRHQIRGAFSFAGGSR
jgi:hypothetical protein